MSSRTYKASAMSNARLTRLMSEDLNEQEQISEAVGRGVLRGGDKRQTKVTPELKAPVQLKDPPLLSMVASMPEKSDEETEDDEARRRQRVKSTSKSTSDVVPQRKMPARASKKVATPPAVDRKRKSSEITSARTTTSSYSMRKKSTSKALVDESVLRVLARLVPKGKENELHAQVKKEYRNVLKSHDLVKTDKESGVTVQQSQNIKAWEDHYFELLVFKKAFGHVLVPKVYPDNPPLGHWVAKMRRLNNTNDRRLTKQRKKRLDQVGFAWDAKSDPMFWKVQNTSVQANNLWQERFDDLLAYKKKYGDVDVPKEFREDQRLARWVTKQRKHYRAKQKGEYNTLDDDQERRLLQEGFLFITKSHEQIRAKTLKRFESRWEAYYAKLKDFKNEHGHCAVPRRWKEDQQLASWVMRQRFQWKRMNIGGRSFLTPERVKLLEKIGFAFVVPRKGDADYEEKRQKLLRAQSPLSKVASRDFNMPEAAESEQGYDEKSGNKEGSVEPSNPDFRDKAARPQGQLETELVANSALKTAKGNLKDVQQVDEDASDDARSSPFPLRQDIHVCKICGKDKFRYFVEAQAHEARCLGLEDIKMDLASFFT